MNGYKSPNEKILDMAVEIRLKLDQLGYPSEYNDKVKELIQNYVTLRED